MNLLNQAKDILKDEKVSCAALKENERYISGKKGIAPIMDNFLFFNGAYVADRVVGRAAAMLFARAGVKELYAEVMSSHACTFLKSVGIPCTAGAIVPYIINRRADGMCPMEAAVLHIEDPEEAFVILKKKVEEMTRNF